MRVKCLSRVTPPHDVQVITAVPRPNYEDNQVKSETKTETVFWDKYISLGYKRYVAVNDNGEFIELKDLCEELLVKSKKEPQSVVEISNRQSKYSTQNRLWLYDETLYEALNIYNQHDVKLLIREWIENEKRYLKKLERKFKS